MKGFAIRGHKTRGKEVIAFLEMQGGRNIYRHDGTWDRAYYIGNLGVIEDLYRYKKEFKYYCLEEIEAKYPYKIGDNVCLEDVCQKELSNSVGLEYLVRKGVYEITDFYWDSVIEDFRYRLRGFDCTIKGIELKNIVPLLKKDVDRHCYADFNVAAYEAYSNAIKRNKTVDLPNHDKDVLVLLEEFSELAKASEEKPSEHIPEYTEAAEELADIIIGCMTELYKRNVDVGSIIRDKMNFNETRQS